MIGDFFVSSSYFASQNSLFGSEDTAVACNAILMPVLIAIRDLEGMHLSSLRIKMCFYNLGEGYTCELTSVLII